MGVAGRPPDPAGSSRRHAVTAGRLKRSRLNPLPTWHKKEKVKKTGVDVTDISPSVVDVDSDPRRERNDDKAMTSSPAVLRRWWWGGGGGVTDDRRPPEKHVREYLKTVHFQRPRTRPP